MHSIFWRSIFASIAVSIASIGTAIASPLDGNYYSSFGSDDYFAVVQGKYKPAYSRGTYRSIAEFVEISPLILKDTKTGVFYCNSMLRTSKGGKPSADYYPLKQYRCSRSGWVFVSN